MSSAAQASALTDPWIGAVIGGRYRVASKIASGGMGAVYRATQIGLERPVALKLLKEEVSWDAETVTRFHREAKAMSLLVHPNTVRVFDFGQTSEGTLYLAMELLEGKLLTERLDELGRLPQREVIQIGIEILSSLHEAHSKGIIHRDLKPDNVYLASVEGYPQPVAKVLDFGIAKVFEGENEFDQLETQAGTVFGTPRYMSPEQAQGKPLDARSDLYSVGVLLYHLVTGLPPFRDDDAVVVMAAHIRDKPEPPLRAAPEAQISNKLNKALLRALEKVPAKRFSSAAEFIEALQAAGEQSGVVARLRGPEGARGRLALVLLALAILLFAFGTYQWLRPPSPTPETAGWEATDLTSLTETSQQLEVIPLAEDPAAEAPLEGTMLSSSPSAGVYRDGELLGETPLRVEEPGFVQLRAQGYRRQSIRITGEPEQHVNLRRISRDAPAEEEGSPPDPEGPSYSRF